MKIYLIRISTTMTPKNQINFDIEYFEIEDKLTIEESEPYDDISIIVL